MNKKNAFQIEMRFILNLIIFLVTRFQIFSV